MTRIRGVLIDNSLSPTSVYTNVPTTVAAANAPAHNLAVIKHNQFSIAAKNAGTAMQVVTDITGWSPANVVTITQITPQLRAVSPATNPCPVGSNLIVSIRYRPLATGIDTVLTTIQMPASVLVASVTSTTLTGNLITCASTSGLTIGMPIYFSNAVGNIKVNTLYYVKSVASSTTFTVSTGLSGTAFVQKNATGSAGVMSSIASVTFAYDFTMVTGDRIFADVTQVGSKSPGMGLITYFYYY